MPLIRKTMGVGQYGTSLFQGRLNTGWPGRYEAAARALPSCKGPMLCCDEGKGSQNSDWGLANIQLIAAQRFSHVLLETFSINDAALIGGVPEVARADHSTNVTAMVAAIRAARADTVIALLTMNGVSAGGQALRPHLVDQYYADDVGLAATLACDLIDNYHGTVTVPGGWAAIAPLDPALTNGAAPFVVAPIAGYVGMPELTTLNPADCSATVLLDATNLVATSNYGVTGANGSVRANTALVGQEHFEFTVSSLQPVVGLANAAMNLGTLPGFDGNSLGVLNNGSVRIGGVQVAALAAPAVGSSIAFDVDNGAHTVFVTVNGARSAAINIAGIAGATYPALGINAPIENATFKPNIDGDGLHPLQAPVDTYLMPNLLTWTAAKQAAYWPN